MIVIVNQRKGTVTGIVSKSSVKQVLEEDELEVVIQDRQLFEAFQSGEELLYDPVAKRVHIKPAVHVDSEKQILYEAIANLHEEIQELKHTGGVE